MLSTVIGFAAQAGITGAAFALALWAMIQLLGTKWVNLHFDRQLELYKRTVGHEFSVKEDALKQRLGSDYAKQLEDTRAKNQILVEEKKGEVQAGIEQNKAEIAVLLARTKEDHELNLEEVRAQLVAREALTNARRNLELEYFRTGMELDVKTQLAISEQRLRPYQSLWELMAPLAPTSTEALDRPALLAAMSEWYFADGNWIFLTWDAMDAYYFANRLLRQNDPIIPDELVRTAFSRLRTQMKIDMSVYTRDDALRQIG